MKEIKINLKKVKELYDSNIEEFGLDAKSVGWGTKEKQYLRFKKLLNVIENKNESFTINELGCGYGELVKYLESNQFKFLKYCGYDISLEMIVAARKYLKNFDNVNLIHNSKLTTFSDYSIASGIFNVKFDESEKLWEKHIKSTLQNMYKNSAKGISFNLLTSYVDFKSENLYYADPMKYFNFCKEELGGKVDLFHSYPLYEWTITAIK